ncbi:prenyltransferase/squalene oxidase repeat-containing protein [Schlesneria paludicola]|uniref:squalene--hopene cyclase n=1 Tax=Schlesneria paludicola TaxID=360056 RepID=UPI00029A37C0|nr:squalene--hopene cyclase [Schlesneria paludicola]
MKSNVVLIACVGLLSVLGIANNGESAEAVTSSSVVDPGPNRRDEPMASEFSLEKATSFLDSAALQWQKDRKCFTCHTNYAHLYARPAKSDSDTTAHEVRQSAEELITRRWVESGPRWDAEIVATGAALAFNDAATTGKLHPLTRQALDRMWTVQRDDGGFTWIKCNWPPMESDDHYGIALAALAVGVAPENYAQTENAQQGMAKLQDYLKKNPGTMLHHRAMVLWASTAVSGLLSDPEKQQIVNELLALQKADGGWGLATLGDWKRFNDEPQETEVSDGYGTGFVVYVLRRSGIPANDARIERGVNWLKSHQRESGRWFTRSLWKDSKHYLTHAGTAFAVMALQECEPQ